MTTFGAEAGVLRLTLLDGTDAIVTVRDVYQTDAPTAFIQPVGAALANWRADCRSGNLTLLALTGLVLALLAGGLGAAHQHAVRADQGALARELTEALPGCGMWRWNLARGHVHWSSPMYRMLGLQPSDKAMAFPRHFTGIASRRRSPRRDRPTPA